MSIVVEYIVSFIVCCRRPNIRRSLMLRTLLASGAFFFFPSLAAAQNTDTLRRETLDEVEISAQRAPSVMHTATPTQVMDAERLEAAGALQLSDAVKQMAGVTLKDYGGVGGIKTVSSRGLGSQFSAVTIDGIPVDDSQNGQVDLGRYTLGNSAYVSLSQGQEEGALLSARAMAAGNVLNMETAEPQFWPGEHIKLRAGIDAGSFGYLSPSLLWEQRWNRRIKSSLYVNYLRSDGDYPFTLYYTTSHNDSSSVERRKHSAVWMLTADGNLFCTLGEGNTLTSKLHYMRGAHELPGPVHLYSQVPSEQYSTEELAFVQNRWRLVREKWKLQVLSKFRYSFDTFLDTTPGSHYDNDYRQQEGFVSGSFSYRLPTSHCPLSFDLATDGTLSHLESGQLNLGSTDRTTLTDVTRFHLVAAAGLHASIPLGTASLVLRTNLIFTHVQDQVAGRSQAPDYQKLSPYFSVMASLGHGTTLRAFYKDSYRVPNFGELYFFQLMAPKLEPEHARQINIGITQALNATHLALNATLDAYYNRINNKIVSYPKQSMYYWSTENLGTVDIVGVDATVELHVGNVEIRGNYTYQHAVDHSQEGSKVYGHQIIYTPRHSGGAAVRWEHSWVNVGMTAMMVGSRYYMQQNTPDYRLPAYCDLGLSADRRFDLPVGELTLRAQLLNLLDTQYEVVNSYPMMGRNWRVAVIFDF